MSGTTEVKHALRKLEYPICAKEALIKIEQLLIGRATSIKHIDLAIDLMAEFVFSEVDRRGNRRNPGLTSLQELQLIQVLSEYFSGGGTDTVKSTVFLSLFGVASLPLRIKILSKLVSMAVCIPSTAVLNAAAIWMQQLGNTSTNSLQLASALVNDFFVFTPSAVGRLKNLPKIAPHFTANFLTAVAEIHLIDKRNTFIPPPINLLETITLWLTENPNLCLAAQGIQTSLPNGAIQMAAVAPLAGLLKWCILAPLYYATYPQDSAPAMHQPEHTELVQRLYAQLHLALLDTLMDDGTGKPLVPAVCAQHLATVIPPLQTQIGDLLKLGRSIRTEPLLQIALDRLSQAIQIALYSRSIYGNIQDLLNQLDQLPENRLLKIVINTNKQIIL